MSRDMLSDDPGMVVARAQQLEKFRVPRGFRGRSALFVLGWQIVHATLFAWSPQPMYAWRRFLLRLFGAEIGRGVLIRPTARVTYPWKLRLGDFAWIGDHAELYTLGSITIGANAVISQRSYLCTGSHDYTDPSFRIFARPIVIGECAWIATDVFVAPGVTVGAGAVVGARSEVFKDLAPMCVARGSPARSVGARVLRE